MCACRLFACPTPGLWLLGGAGGEGGGMGRGIAKHGYIMQLRRRELHRFVVCVSLSAPRASIPPALVVLSVTPAASLLCGRGRILPLLGVDVRQTYRSIGEALFLESSCKGHGGYVVRQEGLPGLC